MRSYKRNTAWQAPLAANVRISGGRIDWLAKRGVNFEMSFNNAYKCRLKRLEAALRQRRCAGISLN